MNNQINANKQIKKAKQVLLFLGLFVAALLLISPLVWLFSASFQNNGEIYQTPFRWIPEIFRFENYKTVWVQEHFGSIMLNTVLASILMVSAQLLLCTITGYVLAKYKFKGRKIITVLILSTSMIPQSTTYFSIYPIMGKLGLLNSSLGLSFPFFVSGFGVFLMMQFCRYVPDEMIESAKIDGCNDWRIFFQIAFPLLRPAVASLSILAFTYIWSEYAWARLCTSISEKQTISIALSMLAVNSDGTIKTSEMLAGGVLAIVPVVILFICFQKNFIEGMTRSGIKG